MCWFSEMIFRAVFAVPYTAMVTAVHHLDAMREAALAGNAPDLRLLWPLPAKCPRTRLRPLVIDYLDFVLIHFGIAFCSLLEVIRGRHVVLFLP